MKIRGLRKASLSVLVGLVISFAIFSGRLTAAEGTGSGSALMQDIAKSITAQPLDIQQLRSLVEPLGWGVTPEPDGSITLVPGACKAKVAPALHAQMTKKVTALMKEKQYACLDCHQVDTALRGPSFKEVAARRRCHKWASELLTYKLSKEGVGPYESAHHMQRLGEEDASLMVDWILAH